MDRGELGTGAIYVLLALFTQYRGGHSSCLMADFKYYIGVSKASLAMSMHFSTIDRGFCMTTTSDDKFTTQ
jgi:hypothetical protein